MALPKSSETKKVNLDFNKEFINTFTQNIERGNVEFVNQTLKDLHEADVANLIENLTSDTRTKLIEIESFNISFTFIFLRLYHLQESGERRRRRLRRRLRRAARRDRLREA